MFGQAIGIDLGTANTTVVTRRRGIVAREPSVVAVHRETRKVVAVGAEAHRMIGRTPESILSVRPVQAGVISNLDTSTALLRHMIRKIAGSRWLRPRLVLAMQTDASEVDKRALAEAAVQAGAGEVYLIEEMLAAAMGADLPVHRPVGSLLVDIGSGTASAAVIALGGVVCSASSGLAGDHMDEVITRYLKKEHNLLIGGPTAERVKIELGTAVPGSSKTLAVPGRLLTTGAPATITLHAGEIYEALSDTLAHLDSMVISVLERTPPELLADISESGLVLTGGVSQLQGLDQRLAKVTGLPTRLAESPLDAVALGTRRVLSGQGTVKMYRAKA